MLKRWGVRYVQGEWLAKHHRAKEQVRVYIVRACFSSLAPFHVIGPSLSRRCRDLPVFAALHTYPHLHALLCVYA